MKCLEGCVVINLRIKLKLFSVLIQAIQELFSYFYVIKEPVQPFKFTISYVYPWDVVLHMRGHAYLWNGMSLCFPLKLWSLLVVENISCKLGLLLWQPYASFHFPFVFSLSSELGTTKACCFIQSNWTSVSVWNLRTVW